MNMQLQSFLLHFVLHRVYIAVPNRKVKSPWPTHNASGDTYYLSLHVVLKEPMVINLQLFFDISEWETQILQSSCFPSVPMIWGRWFWNEIPNFFHILDFKTLSNRVATPAVVSYLSYLTPWYTINTHDLNRKLTKCGWEEKDLHIPSCLPHVTLLHCWSATLLKIPAHHQYRLQWLRSLKHTHVFLM